jgi:hypothetical protein
MAGASMAKAQPTEGRNVILQRLVDCRKLAEDAARLACFDAAVGAVDQAEAKGDIVVVGREQARAARKQAFGFNIPTLSIFERGERAEDLDRVSEQIAQGYRQGDGKWTIELVDGGVWTQTDSEPLNKAPRPGSKAEIRRATMGSYFVNIDGQRALRMRRTR